MLKHFAWNDPLFKICILRLTVETGSMDQIYLENLIQDMSAKPICLKDKQQCERVCVHPDCNALAFVCKNNLQCQNIHRHSPSVSLVSWAEVDQLNSQIFKNMDEYIRNTLKDVTQKVETIITEMRQTLSRYVVHLNEIRASLKLKPEIQSVTSKLASRDCSKITGKEMASFVHTLKMNNPFENKQQVLTAVAKLNERGYKLMSSLRKKMTEFLQKDHQEKPNDSHNNTDKVTKLTQKIKAQPNNPDRYFQRGLEYSKLGKFCQAEEDYTKALSIRPNFVDAKLNRGIIYYNSNRFSEAEQDYNSAIELDPSNSKAYNNRGRLFHDNRKIELAENDYKRAIHLSPGFVKCYLNRAMLYSECSRLKDAQEDYTKVIQIEDNPKAFSNRGLLRFHQGRYEQAQADYNRAIQLDPNNDGTLNNRGFLFYSVCQYGKALADYNRAVNLSPKSLYYKNRSDTHLKLGNSEEAQEDLKKAKQMKSKSRMM